MFLNVFVNKTKIGYCVYMDKKSANILIVDDDSLVTKTLGTLLSIENYVNVELYNKPEDALEYLKIQEVDLILSDFIMPNMNGIEVLQEPHERRSKVKVIMLTIHNEGEYILKAVDIGCAGYVLKDSDSNMLKKAIYTVYSGESFIQPDLIPVLNARLIKKEQEDEQLEKLTKREIEVLILLSEGLFNKEIAYKLDISERTVKNHISNIFKKINVSDRTQAAVFAIKNSLVKL